MIDAKPVSSNFNLCRFERYIAITDLIMQIILNLILFMKARLGASSLGPQVRNIVGAAQFQTHQVINFILTGQVLGDAILCKYLILHTLGDIAY